MNTGMDLLYLLAGTSFVLALKWLSHPKTARRGVLAGEIGMVAAVVGTLAFGGIVSWTWIVVALFIGSAIGIPIAVFVPMTAMPQRIAVSHAFGALAAALVGVAEYWLGTKTITRLTMGVLGVEIVLGFLTFTGSIVAFGKLQGLFGERPWVYRGQMFFNLSIFGAAMAGVGLLVADPTQKPVMIVVSALALFFGVLLVTRIGGADMPTVISLLNSFAGLSGAALGFVLNNKVLIIAGALDGSSGLLLSIIMCRAMNRSFANVLFGGFGKEAGAAGQAEERPIRSTTAEEAAMILDSARLAVIVPGYGMAAAQAQHKIAELAEMLERHGVEVKFAIHPVAGRMPGHMNVLLAEANVPYDHLFDLDQINPDLPRADVVLVVGANDVVNPAARTQEDSPIYGMPIIDADKAQCVIVMKRSMRSGFAGVENDLFYLDKTLMLFGDARAAAGDIVSELSKMSPVGAR